MEMSTVAVPAFVALISMLVIDAVWLTCMGPRLYRPRIGHLMRRSPRLMPAVLFYVIYITGLSFFVLEPAITENAGVYQSFIAGALFGLVTYATYDLTNHATLERWPLSVTVVDLVWGSILTGGVSVLAIEVSGYIL